jgi:hypothetical protein
LTDGFTRKRIATFRSLGFGFFIGLSLERGNADFPRRALAALRADDCSWRCWSGFAKVMLGLTGFQLAKAAQWDSRCSRGLATCQ